MRRGPGGVDAAALRRYAIARTLVPSPTAPEAVVRLGFVQYDPIRSPACAQDLILRHRVAGYRAGDLDRDYPEHPLEEAFLHVYGVMPATLERRLHPRGDHVEWRVEREHPGLARRVLRHLRERDVVHPRDLARALGAAATTSGWGGSTPASTRVLDMLQYRGLARVARRAGGIRVYARSPGRPRAEPAPRRAEAMLATLLRLYAPLPAATFAQLARMVGGRGLDDERRERALARYAAGPAVASATVDRVRYLWPADENPLASVVDDRVRALAPFDPIAWDRRRFGHLWGWPYRFEAYTPAAKRVYGYYALPLVWREHVVGWLNATPSPRGLAVDVRYAGAKPRGPAFRRALDEEVESLQSFARAGHRRAGPGARTA
ncbi:MAG: crosslink repair DNA glycosylase YcaQ family protein [Burkholderiales bacterium]